MEITGGPFWVYVLQNPAGRFYVGSTDDWPERIKQHNPSTVDYQGSKYTHKNGPWNLVYYESYQTRSEAMAREKFIKSRKSAVWIRTNLLSSRASPDVHRDTRGVVSCFIKMIYVSRHNHSKYLSTVLYRLKTVHTVLDSLRFRLEILVSIEVTTFFKR